MNEPIYVPTVADRESAERRAKEVSMKIYEHVRDHFVPGSLASLVDMRLYATKLIETAIIGELCTRGRPTEDRW